MKKTEHLLTFKGKRIFYAKDTEGNYHVAIKPICLALQVDFERQRRETKKDLFLSQLLSVQTVVAADGKVRKMVCLPEKYIYGWLFGIKYSNTMKPETKQKLTEYKRECYDILYNHFRGVLIRSIQRLTIIADYRAEEQKLTNELRIENQKFIRLEQVKAKRMREIKQLYADASQTKEQTEMKF